VSGSPREPVRGCERLLATMLPQVRRTSLSRREVLAAVTDEAFLDAAKLLILADWFDMMDATVGVINNPVSGDLRRMAYDLKRFAEYENAVTWGTSCLNCARILDESIAEHERADKAEAEVARLRAAVERVAAKAERTAHEATEDYTEPEAWRAFAADLRATLTPDATEPPNTERKPPDEAH
jgi:hypothetical protein